jgi:carbon storage regulator
MLVFARRRHEAIVIGDGIEVRVLRIGRDSVRLGITAPSTVSVHRREIYSQIRRDSRGAATTAASAASPAEGVCRESRDATASVPDAAAAASPEVHR